MSGCIFPLNLFSVTRDKEKYYRQIKESMLQEVMRILNLHMPKIVSKIHEEKSENNERRSRKILYYS
jgi:hypothetical protein